MERIDKSISKNYLPLTLYLDDLEEIESALPADSKLEIEAGDYKFDSISEFAANAKAERIHDFELTVRNPYLHIEFKRMWARVYAGSSAPAIAGVFYNIDQILRRRHRLLAFCYTFYFVWALNGVNVLATFLLSRRVIASAPAYLSWSITGFTFSALVFILWIRMRRYATVVARHRRDAHGFFERNRDNLIVGLVAAVVGATVGVILTLVFSGQHK